MGAVRQHHQRRAQQLARGSWIVGGQGRSLRRAHHDAIAMLNGGHAFRLRSLSYGGQVALPTYGFPACRRVGECARRRWLTRPPLTTKEAAPAALSQGLFIEAAWVKW